MHANAASTQVQRIWRGYAIRQRFIYKVRAKYESILWETENRSCSWAKAKHLCRPRWPEYRVATAQEDMINQRANALAKSRGEILAELEKAQAALQRRIEELTAKR